MPQFDFDSYFSNRLAAVNKLQEVDAASTEKTVELEKASAEKKADLAGKTAPWSDQLGLRPGTFLANRVNDAASLVSGASRLAGQIASLPVSAAGGLASHDATPEDYDAYNRVQAGTATPEDWARLNQRTASSDRTILEGLRASDEARRTARQINDTADLTGIVNQQNRQGLSQDLAQGFDENWAKATSGDFSETAKGIGGLIYNAGRALAHNPSAVREYVLENAPQLLVGAAGKVGQLAMTAGNVGYAVDEYQKGIEAYQKANDGALPPEDVRARMALQAASLAGAEQLGDMVGLGATKLAGEAVAGSTRSMKKALTAAAEGVATEAPTEAFQTYMEGQIEGKPATAQEIYEAGVIGGASGGVLSGGGRAVHEAAKPDAEKPAATDTTPEIDALRKEAAKTGDVSALVDTAPDQAIAALMGHSKQEGTTEEAKQANLQKSQEIVTGLQKRQQDLYAQLDEHMKADPELESPEATKAMDALADINHQLGKAEKVHKNLETLVRPMVKVDEIVEAADKGSDTKAAEQVINLAMSSPEALTEEHVKRLVDNTGNGLSTEQRDFLRQFTAARQAMNALRDRDAVGAEIYNGSKNNLGLKQYRDWVLDAVSRGDQKTADKYLELLDKFSKSHTDKARKVLAASTQPGEKHVARLESGGWEIRDGHLPDAERRANGAVNVKRNKLPGDIRTEASTISATAAALRAAYATKFTTKGKSDVQNVPTQGKDQGAERQAAEVQGTRAAGKGSEPVAAAPAPGTRDAGVQAGGVTTTWDNLTPGQQVTLYRGESAANDKNGQWWTTDRAKAAKYGKVTEVTLPAETVGANSVKGHNGADEFVFLNKRPTELVAPPAQTEATQGDSVSSVNPTEVDSSSTEGLESTQKTELTVERDATVVGQAPAAPADEIKSDDSSNTPASREEVLASDDVSVVSGVDKSPEGTTYQSRNLVRDFFKQTAGRAGEILRPLASVKDFLTHVTMESVLPFIGVEKLTEAQEKLLQHFETTATGWFDSIRANLFKPALKEGAESFAFRNMMEFLVQGEGKDVDVAENVKTAMAYAAYSWIAENASRSPFNSDDEINAILDRPDSTIVTPRERALLRDAGIRENVVVNTLGQRAVQALGLKTIKDAPVDLQARFESAVGAHVYKLLVDQGIIARTSISGSVLAELGLSVNNENAKNRFVKLASDGHGAFHPDVVAIAAASKNTQGVLDKLFGVEAGLKEPSIGKPIPYVQETTKNTNQRVPKVLAEIMQKENDTPFFVRQDMWALMQQISDETLMRIAGAEDGNGKHVYNAKAAVAAQDSLQREVQRFREFVSNMQDPEEGLYFEHVVWKQQRVGIATNVINPQTSKVHRHMLYRQAWDTKVDTTDQAQMENFFLRVGEGLGVKTDKKTGEAALAEAMQKMEASEIKAAVDVLVQMLQGTDLTEDQQATLVAGVGKGGEAMHSLDAIMALAQFQFALGNGQNTFQTQLMGEVDGVTNGPMLTHLLLGAAGSVEELYALLNRGGFYQVGQEHTQYNQWRGTPGNLDLYESTIRNVLDTVAQLVLKKDFKERIDPLLLPSVYAFTGALENKDGGIEKAGRNIIKTPLTAMVFGSSVDKAIDSMAAGFVESIYDMIEKTAAGDEKALSEKDLFDHIDKLLGKAGPLPSNWRINDLMKHEFDGDQLKALMSSFKYTLGKAVKQTMAQDFGVFMERRRQFNDAAQLAFELHHAAETALRKKKIAELVEKGEIAYRTAKDGSKTPIHALTQAQEAELRQELAALAPVMHTALSKESGSRAAGLNMSKSDRKLSQDKLYSQEVVFARSFEDESSMRLNTHGYERTSSSPGVAMAVMSTHSADSAISHRAVKASGYGVLNVHDAHGAGLANFHEVAQNLNHSTWNAMLEYSSPTEVYEALARTVRGFAHLVDKVTLPAEAAETLKKALAAYASDNNMEETPSITTMLIDIKTMAHKAEDMKLQVMEQMQYVDQYALEGGNYQVTDDDRAQAAAKRAALQPKVSERDRQAAEKIDALLNGQEKVTPAENIEVDPRPATSPFGQLGQPKLASDPDLVKFFQNNPSTTVGTVIKHLYTLLKAQPESRKRDFYIELLQVLNRTTDKNLPVTLVTKDSPASLVKDITKVPFNAHGWYNSQGEGIFVLSQDFVQSAMVPELMLHEMTHNALVDVVDQAEKGNATKSVIERVNSLKALLEQARAHVKGTEAEGRFKNALDNIHEFLAWGMTNQSFQREVLAQIQVATPSKQPISAWKKFVQTVTAILFHDSSKSKEEQNNSAMAAFLSDTSALFAQAEKAPGRSGNVDLNLAMAAPANTFSTIDIFEALDDGQGNISPTFAATLRSLLGGIVGKLHGPFGTFKAQLMKDTQDDALGVWFNAMASGKLPFASKVVASGFRITDQELYAIEQVEATVRAAIDGDDANTKLAYRELSALYQEAYNKLKPADFQTLGGTTAQAQALYDFVFKMEKDNGDRSDYLARFAAMGLAHEGVAGLLKFNTTTQVKATKTFAEKMQAFFEKILSLFQERVTNTYAGQRADAKLQSLVTQLVEIEAKRREAILDPGVANKTLASLEESGKKLAAAVRGKIEKAALSPIITQSKSGIVKGVGALVHTVAGGYVDSYMAELVRLRDRNHDTQQGIRAGLLTEVRGPEQVYEELLRARKFQEGKRKNIIEQTAKLSKQVFANGGRGLTKDMNAGVTQTLLRTGAHVLMDAQTGLARLQVVMEDAAELQKDMAALKAQLPAGQVGNMMAFQAEALGFYKATGINKSPFLHMNAHGIAHMTGTAWMEQVSEEQAAQLEPVLEKLVALHGIQHTNDKRRKDALAVLKTENQRTDGNGVAFLLGLQARLEKDSLDRLFGGNKALMVHGYTPEIYNPHIEVRTADAIEGKDLVAQGWVKGARVQPDPHDPDQTVKHLYVMRDGGLQPWLSSIVSYTGTKAKGAKMHSGFLNPNTRAGANNASMNATVINARTQQLQQIAAGVSQFDASKTDRHFMAPLFNENGDVVNFRDLMQESTKDDLLMRDNRFEHVLGMLAGSIFDKDTAGEVNAQAIEVAKRQYDAEYEDNTNAYMEVSDSAKDPELREIWRMLPPQTKAQVRRVWGRDAMWVRKDTLDIMFGYRKLSLADAYKKDPKVRSFLEQTFVDVTELIFGQKAALRIRQGERAWQELVKEAKDNIVVKSGVVLMGNIWSNFSQLWIQGVPLKDMAYHHLVALKGATAYMNDSGELRKLRTLLDVGHTQGKDAEIKREILRLEDALARNPVGKLIEAGLMPSIVDDVEQDENIYSYKSLLARKSEKITSRLHPSVIQVAKTMYMAHDTPLYKGLSRATQLSDFVARYTLYQHLTTRTKDPVDPRTALFQASESFVNYDIPSHRKLQYANDMGIVMFTKYFLRIQRVLGKASKDSPLRYYTALLLQNTLGLGPIVLDSLWFTHIGNNPIRPGAFGYLGTEDEILPIATALKLIK